MGGQTLRTQAAEQVAQHPRLPAMQMCAAGDVDPQTVRRIGGGQGGVAHAPFRQSPQGGRIAGRVGIVYCQAGDQGLRLRQLHAGTQAQSRRGRIHRRQYPAGDDDARTAGTLPHGH